MSVRCCTSSVGVPRNRSNVPANVTSEPSPAGTLVTFAGTLLRFLGTPTELVQQRTDIVHVVLDAKTSPNQILHHWTSPTTRHVAPVACALRQCYQKLIELPTRQLRSRSEMLPRTERLATAKSPGDPPPRSG